MNCQKYVFLVSIQMIDFGFGTLLMYTESDRGKGKYWFIFVRSYVCDGLSLFLYLFLVLVWWCEHLTSLRESRVIFIRDTQDTFHNANNASLIQYTWNPSWNVPIL